MSEKAIRVLHVIPGFGMGGAERVILDLFQVLDRHSGIELRLCVLDKIDWEFPERRFKIPPVTLGFDKEWRDVGPAFQCIRRLRRLIREFRPHVLHTHLWIADLYGAIAAMRIPLLHVCQFHNTEYSWLTSSRLGFRFRRAVYKSMVRLSRARFIAVSDGVKDYYFTRFPYTVGRTATIINGVDNTIFRPADATLRGQQNGGEIVIGAAGRFIPRKGHEDLFRAMAKLNDTYTGWELHIAGDGPLWGEYEALIRDLGIDGKVKLLGPLKDMSCFYRDLDIFVQPSRPGEGLGITILEAMATGIPVIVTDITGPPEVVRHGIDGLIVEPEDVRGLSTAIERMIRDSSERSAMGAEGIQRVKERFTIEQMAASILEFYRQPGGGC